MREIYFDNSATTKVCPEAIAAAVNAMENTYGNPSSLHSKGVEAARLLGDARRVFAAALQVKEAELFFTSCATESNNTVIAGVSAAHVRKGKHILVSAVEHPSVLEPALALKDHGFEVDIIPVDRFGVVDIDAFTSMLREDTILVSVQQVNNEVGAIQPLAEIGALVKAKSPAALFHVDGVQGFCKAVSHPEAWQADFYSLSGHKIGAPKGVGLLWAKKGVRWLPLLRGGGQESNLRSGTENIAGICAFAAAAKKHQQNIEKSIANMAHVRAVLAEKLAELADIRFNSDLENGAPHILNVSFKGAKSEVLLHYLEMYGLFVSSGSACHSNKKGSISPVLQAMNVAKEYADCAIRFSFSPENTEEEALAAFDIIKNAVADIRGL